MHTIYHHLFTIQLADVPPKSQNWVASIAVKNVFQKFNNNIACQLSRPHGSRFLKSIVITSFIWKTVLYTQGWEAAQEEDVHWLVISKWGYDFTNSCPLKCIFSPTTSTVDIPYSILLAVRQRIVHLKTNKWEKWVNKTSSLYILVIWGSNITVYLCLKPHF